MHPEKMNQEEFKDVSLEFQVNDFVNLARKIFPSCNKFDFAGFSFGGRVAMAIASTHPHMIRKLHLTGVSASRDEFGNIILSSWKDMLKSKTNDGFPSSGELIGFAWSIIMTTYSEEFLASCGSEKIRTWVDHIQSCNSASGLYALIDQTNSVSDENDPWHPLSVARRICESKENGHIIEGKIFVGSKDKISTPSSAQKLSEIIGWGNVHIYDGIGHAVPMESARIWRKDLVKFLKQ